MIEEVAESRWAWARAHRRLFTTPQKDILSALVVGLIGGAIRYAGGDANWRTATLATLGGGLIGGVLLPQVEALYWLWRRNAVLLSEARSRIAELQAAPAVVAPAAIAESQRLQGTRRILGEAAEYVRAMPSGLGDAGHAVRMAYVVHETVPELLTRAFLVPPTADYFAFIEAEKQKQRDKFDMRIASSDFLVRLSGRIVEDNLDQGFLMPTTWLQFRESDPTLNWPANVR